MKPTESVSAHDLEFSFDVGHSSIGWAVLKALNGAPTSDASRIEILGCGVVTFGADDCLASKRRDYRRQRRHARSTRQRVARLEMLLAHMKVLTQDQIRGKHQAAGGHPGPWLLAARVLASDGKPQFLLDWPELWDVLRWYAHNRGYDGNRRWSGQEAEAEEDTEKEQHAAALMEQHATKTMAETLCKTLGLDPLGDKRASAENFKRADAAFPREIVEKEVSRILELHRQKLPAIDEIFLTTLFNDWRAAAVPDLALPSRYQGGLLFGQLVPRFDNRIISVCPISGQKVPSKNCPEFYRFRWAMILANIVVGKSDSKGLRPLTPEERKKLDDLMKQEGALTPSELKRAVRETSGCARDNLETMLMDPDAKDALILDPVQKLVRSDKLLSIWSSLSPRVQKRVRDLWLRGKSVSPAEMSEISRKLKEPTTAFEEELGLLEKAASKKAAKKAGIFSRSAFLAERFSIKKEQGRARYARPVLVQAHAEVMAGGHPMREGGCLFVTEQMRKAQLNERIDRQTNNHLVRHRLLIFERLLKDLIADPAFGAGNPARISKTTIEVNRDLREMSGKTAKQIEQELGRRKANHHHVAEKLAKELDGKTFGGRTIQITAGLIRKARVAEDLGWACPYTGKEYDALDLVSRKVDKDHIIPRSLRPSDSLDSLVITFSEVNRMKKQRTAWQFIQEHESQTVPGLPQLSILSSARYRKFVEDLDARKGHHEDDKRRKKRRKEMLLLPSYEEKEFTPRDLTATSQLVRLGAQIIKKTFASFPAPPTVVSLPGSVTGVVRKSWNLLGCLSLAAPQVMEPDGSVKTKTEVSDLTHLHHALDACVLGLAAHYLPNNGGLWEAMLKRNPNDSEKTLLRATGFFDFNSENRFGLIPLPDSLKEQIRRRLAEKRVVQHIPADMSGMRVEENTRGIEQVKDGRVALRQQSRDPKTGKLTVKKTDESINKVIGLRPGKLAPQKGVRVITDNFGVAILDHAQDPQDRFAVLPWHKVWPRIRVIKERNGGKKPRILRIGNLIRIPDKAGRADYRGLWMVRGVKAAQVGIMIDMSSPDVISYTLPGRDDCARNVRLQTLYDCGLEILKTRLIGVPSPQQNAQE